MKKVLLVSPHFPPTNAPDMQRVRMALPYFKEFGWEPTVLCVDADDVESSRDPLLERALPSGILIIRTKAFPSKVTRRFGFGSLSFRALPFLRSAGDCLLKKERFDAAFFSTTQFGIMSLAPRWKKRYGLPYLVDMQDPWVSNYDYANNAPPGGKFKYAISQFSARRKEPGVIKNASGIISVSPAYVADLQKRYPKFPADHFHVMPFAAAEQDFDFVKRASVGQNIFDPRDGHIHWVYTGRGGTDLKKSLSGIFIAVQQWRNREPSIANNLLMHFIGTSYAPEGKGEKTVVPVAAEYGVADLVRETPARIPYFETLRCMLDANALIIPGSDDAGYTASKIYSCILARKPLLAVFHRESTVLDVLRKTNAGTGIGFSNTETAHEIASKIMAGDWIERSHVACPSTNWAAVDPYLARTMTEQLCKILDRAAAAK